MVGSLLRHVASESDLNSNSADKLGTLSRSASVACDAVTASYAHTLARSFFLCDVEGAVEFDVAGRTSQTLIAALAEQLDRLNVRRAIEQKYDELRPADGRMQAYWSVKRDRETARQSRSSRSYSAHVYLAR